MRRRFATIPLIAKIPIVVLLVVVGLVLLVILFEYAGGLLDTGGVVGA